MWLAELWLKHFLCAGWFCGLYLVSVLYCLIAISWCLSLSFPGDFFPAHFHDCSLLLMDTCCLSCFPWDSWSSQCVSTLRVLKVPLDCPSCPVDKWGLERNAACKATVFWNPLSCSLTLFPCLQCCTILQHANLEITGVGWALAPPCVRQEAGICSALLM